MGSQVPTFEPQEIIEYGNLMLKWDLLTLFIFISNDWGTLAFSFI